MSAVVYDTGALIAAERNDRAFWADHRARLELGAPPITPAPVVAQASRSPRQVQLRRVLRGCEVAQFDEAGAHAVGRILAESGTDDIVDGTVVAVAVEHSAEIVTTDRADIARLLVVTGTTLRIIDI